MKITIEPSNSDDKYYPTISVARNSDELNITQTMDLIEQALAAWGFGEKSIEDYFKGDK